MPNPNFPGPNINRVIEDDPQIIKIDLEKNDIGFRKSQKPKDFTSSGNITHVKS